MNTNNGDRESRIAKIKRLLALAKNNSNPNEAAAVLLCAQKLMHKYDITEADIALSAIGELRKETICGLKDKETVCSVAFICAAVFGMESIFNYRGKSCVGVTFIGVKEDLELVGYVYDFLCRQVLNAKVEYQIKCKKRLQKKAQSWVECYMPEGSELYAELRQHGMEPLNFAYKYLKCNQRLRALTKSYILGYLQAVKEKVHNFRDDRLSKLIELYRNKRFGELEDIKHTKLNLDRRALLAGWRDGDGVNLLRPVSGQANASLIAHRQ